MAILRTNPAVSDARRTQLGVTTRASPTPARVPVRPDVRAQLTGLTSIRVVARDPARPERRGKPRGVALVEVRACFTTGGAPPPADVAEWPMSTLSGKTTVDLSWPGMSGEATVWVCCTFVNTRMAHGQPSGVVSVRLPGNGFGTAAPATAATAVPAMEIAA